jgi:hypothetical protein
MPNPIAGSQPLFGCPRLLIQYIYSYPSYLEAASSIRNLRTRHAVVSRDPPNIVHFDIKLFLWILWHLIPFACTCNTQTLRTVLILSCSQSAWKSDVISSYCIGFEVVTAVFVKITIFWLCLLAAFKLISCSVYYSTLKIEAICFWNLRRVKEKAISKLKHFGSHTWPLHT